METKHMKTTKICENTIENLTFEIYTNNNKRAYQTLTITDTKCSTKRTTNMIAPVDFYDIISAILCTDQLCDFIDAVSGTWSANMLEDMINEITDLRYGEINY